MYTEYDKTIAIPIDEEGVMDYENDISKVDRLRYFTLPVAEFKHLWKCGFFDRLNNEFNLLIDDYEEEIIPNHALEKTEALFKEYTSQQEAPVFWEALQFAKKCNTEVCLEF